MRIRFDNILLCILWLLAVTLGACFWFNTVFGFDIFSASHWGYVASMQAARTPIKTGFYISVATTIFITIFGLYLILRPRMRKIRLPIMHVSNIINKETTDNPSITPQNPDASTLDILPAELPPAQTSSPTTIPGANARPPRLILPTLNGNYTSSQPTQRISSSPPPQSNNIDADAAALREIFIAAGYTVKPNPRIGTLQTTLIAIGANETMWIGCVGLKTTDVRTIIEKFQQIFSDTLDETSIEINGFVINAPDAPTSEFTDIMMFNSIDQVREYIRQNPNPPLAADDDGMFDAYSQYIDAVITHIGKI